MPVETASELFISLPDASWFRFERTRTYGRLRGDALKDMDFGYFDEAAGHLVLVELSSYGKAAAPPVSRLLLQEMIAKARDALLMLQAAWRGHGAGKDLALELPQACRRESRVRLCFVIKLTPEHRVTLTPVAMSNIAGRLRAAVVAAAGLLGLRVVVELFDQRSVLGRLPVTESPPAPAPGA